MFDQIEKLKQDFTDKYVVVDASIPELARFGGHVGQVKTVNMSGRALVEFNAWSNIGWYDIEPEYLRVVPKPEAPPEGKKHESSPAAAKPAAATPQAAKPAASAGEKKLSPLEMARLQGAAKGAAETPAAAPPAGDKAAPAGTAKKSTADVLAAARAAKAASAPAAEKPPAEKPAGATAQAKPSTADILAAARANKAAEASATPVVEVPAPAVEAAPVVESAPAATKPKAAAVSPPAVPPAFTPGQRPSVAEILAWCRQHDAK